MTPSNKQRMAQTSFNQRYTPINILCYMCDEWYFRPETVGTITILIPLST